MRKYIEINKIGWNKRGRVGVKERSGKDRRLMR